MIGLNPLRTPVLVTTDEVIFHAPVDHDVDSNTLLNNIIVAEQRFVEPVLGYQLYELLIEKKNKLVDDSTRAQLQTDINAGRGTDRMEIKLVNGDYVNSDTYLTTDEQKLWKKYLHKVCAEAVYLMSLVTNRTRFTAAGMMKNMPESVTSERNSVTADLNDLKHLIDKAYKERLEPLIAVMKDYMCRAAFPGYNCSCGPCGQKNIASSGQTGGVIFGMYDDHKINRGCNWDH